MTTRLLTSSGRAPRAQTVLEALHSGSLRPILTIDGSVVSAAELPLFKRRDGGVGGGGGGGGNKVAAGLEQVVRVQVAPVLAGVERIELRDARGTRVAWNGPLPEQGMVDLLVPEVTTVASWQLAVVVGGEEHRGEIHLAPSRKLTVHLVQHSHLDIGYTDPQGIVLRNHLEYLDAAVELGAQGDGTDHETRFKWTVESNFPVRAWLAQRPAETVREFCRLAREDVLEVSAMPFNLHTEAASQEELARLLRTTLEMRERYQIPIRTAMHTDVPGATPGWVDALADAGVRYLSAAHNWAGRSVPYLTGGQELGRPFWWRSAGGARILTWFTDSAHGAAYMEGNFVGFADSYDETVKRLPMYLQALTTKPFPYSEDVLGFSGFPADLDITKQPYPHDFLQLRVQGSHSDNACPNAVTARIARRWNSEWAYPRLISATNHSFLAEAERKLGQQLAEHTGDWGDWWADGLGSGARPLGYNRRSQSLLRTAETTHLLADLATGETDSVRDDIDQTYDKVGLFDEHTWGAANPWHDHEHGPGSGALQWARKSEYAQQAYDDVQDLLHAGVRRLGATLGAATDARCLGSVVVYNTAGWARSDVVNVFLPESEFSSANDQIGVVDARKDQSTPARVAREERAAAPRGWHVQFVAVDVPALGWARFDLVPDADPLQVSAPADSWRISNEFFALTYDAGRAHVASIVDRAAGRELVNPDALTGVNEYIYDTYGSAPHVNHLSSRMHAPDLTLLTSRSVADATTLVRSERSGLGEVLEVETYAPGADRIRTTIALYAGVPRVDITNRISKRAGSVKESGYFAFPLAGSAEPMFELTGSITGPGIPHVPGAPQHMRAIRHWAALAEGGYTSAWATLEAPLVQSGTIHLPYAPFPSTINAGRAEPATIYSWVFNNIWDTNFPAQQHGDLTFRYAVAGAADASPQRLGAATAAGLTDPLVPVLATGSGQPGAVPAPATGCLLTVDTPHVVVSSMGHPLGGAPGVALRLRSLELEPVEAVISLDEYRATSAAVATLFEDRPEPVPVRDGRVQVPIPAGTTRTLLLH